jgi:hypothetical protein
MPNYSCKYCYINEKQEYFNTKDKCKWEKHEQSKKHQRIFEVFNDVDPSTAHQQFDKSLIISTNESKLQDRINLLENILKRNNIDFPK